jgi:hypothetical protein
MFMNKFRKLGFINLGSPQLPDERGAARQSSPQESGRKEE